MHETLTCGDCQPRTESRSTGSGGEGAAHRDLEGSPAVELVVAVERVEAFAHALEGQLMADHGGEVDVAALHDRYGADEVFVAAAPDAFQAQVGAQKVAVRVDLDRTDVDEVAGLDEDAVLFDQLEPFGEGGQEAGGLDDHVAAGAAGRQPQHDLLAFAGVGHGADVDRLVGAQFAGELEAAGGSADDDQFAGAADPGRDHAHDADRAGALDDDGIADLDVGAQRGVDADRKGLGEHADLRRLFRFDHAAHRVGQVDVVGEATAEWLIRAAHAVGDAAVAGMEDDAIALFDRRAEVVGGDAFAEGLDSADVLMAEEHRRLDALLPPVQIGAADAGQLLPQQDRARRRVGYGIFGNCESLSFGYDRMSCLCHVCLRFILDSPIGRLSTNPAAKNWKLKAENQ